MGVGAQRSPSSSARAVPVATFLSQRVITRVAGLTDRLVDTIQQGNPGYRTATVVPEDDLWRSCHDNLIRLLQLVGSVEARFDHVYYDAARATGRRRAEQGLPLDDVLRSFRIGSRLVWEALVVEARSFDVDEVMLDVGTRVWEVVDRSSAQLASAYHDAVRNAVRADEQRRTAIWEGLLTGVAEDPGFAFEAARMLEVPVDASYLVVVAEPSAPDSEAVRRIRDRLAALRVRSTWQARGASLVGLVVLSGWTRELDALRDVVEVRGGASSPVHGLGQVHVGFRHAALALRTLGPGDRFAALDERLPEAILVQSPELAQQLVHTWLGSLIDLPEAERTPLMDTLEAWVETSGSAGRTAELVHCHRNTVLNRLRRLSEATGHDLTTGATPVELVLALRAHRVLGPGPRTVRRAQAPAPASERP